MPLFHITERKKESIVGERSLETEFWGDTQVLKKKKKKRKLRPGVQVLALFLVLFAAFGYLGYSLADNWLSEGLGIGSSEGSDQAGALVPDESKKLTLLLMGVDRRDKEASRADTIIVAFIDMDTKKVNLLSIPRDTLVDIPGHGETKINHAHAYGGAELMAETVSDFLGVPVNKYVELDFEGFENIVDILGGVTIDVPERMYRPSEGIDLRPGEQQHLDGEEALQFVRYRGKMGDIGRIENQQKFLKTMADQAISLGTVVKLPSLIKETRASTNTNLSLKQMLGLAKIAQAADMGQIETAMVPGDPIYIKGVSYWQPRREETDQLVDKFLARNDARNEEQ